MVLGAGKLRGYRSGWEPPKDTGLWEPAERLKRRVLSGMTPEQRAFWEAEDGYFSKVTSISGKEANTHQPSPLACLCHRYR